jgi:hypothetical protein
VTIDGQEEIQEVAPLERGDLQAANLGLTLVEAKSLSGRAKNDDHTTDLGLGKETDTLRALRKCSSSQRPQPNRLANSIR